MSARWMVLGLVLMFIPAFASADVVFLTAVDSGFVTEEGGTAKGDGTVAPPATYNYSVGQEVHYSDGALFSPLVYMDRKNYFVFDFVSVTRPITSATLMLYMGPDVPPDFPGGEHGYESLDPFETFEIKETTDPGMALGIIADLLFANTSIGPTAFDESTDPLIDAAKMLYSGLGDGATLASITTTSADDDTFLAIDFTPAGLAYLNMFLGDGLVLGGELVTTDGTDTTQLIYGFTGPDIAGGGDPTIPTLLLTTIPEPSGTIFVFALSIVGFVVRRR